MRRFPWAFVLLLVGGITAGVVTWHLMEPSALQSEPQKEKAAPAEPPELLRVKRVASVQVSPDGKRVVYTVTRAVVEGDKSEYHSRIFLADTDGKDLRPLTQLESSADTPKWSPDGKGIAFLSSRNGFRNLWLLRTDGGEAEQLTNVSTAVNSYQWSPDGKTIAFTMRDGLTEAEKKNNKQKDDGRVIDENVKQVRLYVLPVNKDDKGQRKERLLTKGNYSVGFITNLNAYDWSPDGKTIAFTHTPTPSPDDWPRADISLVDVASGEVKPLANGTKGARATPLFSPDGKAIAFVQSDNPPTWAFKMRGIVQPVEGGPAQALAKTFDERPSLVAWSGDQLFFTENHRTATKLFALPLSGPARPVAIGGFAWDGVIGDVHLNRAGTHVGFTAQAPQHPVEAFVCSMKAPELSTQVSRANEALAKVPVGRTEVVRWKSPDGLDIEGLLTYPVGYEKGKKYPFLLIIHGGPAGVFSETYLGNPSTYPVAAFAAKGYAVLRCNPRGSGGYGTKFRHANVKDWGGGDYRDLMAGVDHVIKLGVADEQRMGVMGWSYGGFMTSWVVTQTQRFKAASIGAPVTNLVSFTGTADIPGFLPSYFGGEFWEQPELYRKHSPITHVKGVKTPALILHGEKDDRVPIGQGYEFYNALKRQGVTTKMVVYPRMPHGPTEPRHLLDIMQRNLAWMDQHVRGGKE